MAIVRTDALEVGSTISKDVKNGQGQLLIRTGMVIQERHLMLLKSWGVNEVEVIGAGSAPAGATNAEADTEKGTRVAEIREALKEKFRHNNLQAPLIAELFELCTQRKAKLPK